MWRRVAGGTRRPFSVVVGLVAGIAAVPGAPAAAVPPPLLSEAQGEVVPGEVVVGYHPGARPSPRAAGRARDRAEGRGPSEVRRVRPGAERAEAAALRRRSEVAFAEPNYVRRLLAVPNDPGYPQQWGLPKIAAPSAWDTTDGDSVVVAVVDSGVAPDHPDISPNLWVNQAESAGTPGVDDDGNGYPDDVNGWDFTDGDADPRDLNGHGTHVAGTVAARAHDGHGVAGAAPGARVMSLRVADGNGIITSARVAEAFTYAARMGARVVNGSFGGGPPSAAEVAAIRAAPNVLFVFAAGNDGGDNDANPVYPCSYTNGYGLTNVVCVAATTQTDGLASFSNFGRASVSLGAPGASILSTQPSWGERLFTEDFELDVPGRWLPGGEGSTWARTQEAAKGGASSLTDSPGGSYANNSSTWAALAAPVPLAGQQGCTLDAALRTDTERFADLFGIQAATEPVGPWRTLFVTSGSTGGVFKPLSVSLSRYDGLPVYLRFVLQTDGDITGDGVHLDDLAVRCLSALYSGKEFASWSGTSMAAPFVAGTAALLFSQDPARTGADVRARILSAVDPVAGLAGKTLTGGRLNAFRALTDSPDFTAPSVATVAGAAFSRAFQAAASFPVAWSATDAGSGVGTYDVRVRRARFSTGFGAYANWLSGTPARTATFSGAHGSTYCFSARARDRAGNVGAWGAERCTAIPLNDRSLTGSGFARASGAGYFLNTFSTARSSGAVLRAGSVRYKRLALVATRCPGCGTVAVYVGSARVATVKLDAATTTRRAIIPVSTRTTLSPGVTVTVRVVSSGRVVRVEGLGIGA